MFRLALDRAVELERILRAALPECRVRPLPIIKDITLGDWKKFRTLVLSGISPSCAAQQSFYMSPQTFNKYMKDGAVAGEGTLFGQFYRAVRAVQSTARGIAEARVFYEDPHNWLRGPGGRSTLDEEGWTDRAGSAESPGEPRTINVNVLFSPQGTQVQKQLIDVTPGNGNGGSHGS